MMTLSDWENHAVRQNRDHTGCVPTGYEFVLRWHGVKDIDWASFQDDFDLDRHGGPPRNNFDSVAAEITKKYPRVHLKTEQFAKGRGADKVKRVEELMAQPKAVLVSIAQGDNWHTMPVVRTDSNSWTLLQGVDHRTGDPVTVTLRKSEVERIHEECEGGNDIAYFEKGSTDDEIRD